MGRRLGRDLTRRTARGLRQQLDRDRTCAPPSTIAIWKEQGDARIGS
ncbi:MAG: hypothetical protein ACRD0K_08160 [Egibacteraceae bacterium]